MMSSARTLPSSRSRRLTARRTHQPERPLQIVYLCAGLGLSLGTIHTGRMLCLETNPTTKSLSIQSTPLTAAYRNRTSVMPRNSRALWYGVQVVIESIAEIKDIREKSSEAFDESHGHHDNTPAKHNEGNCPKVLVASRWNR